jgi:hypothetical protein
MRKVTLLLILILQTIVAQGQEFVINGKIIDGSDQTPIAYVAVGIAGTSTGTITNSDGEFVLVIDSTFKQSEIYISHIAYHDTSLSVDAFLNHPVVSLSPQLVQGPEVVVTALTTEDIIRTMIKRSLEVGQKKHWGKAFYRKTNKTNETYTQAIEIFYDIDYGTILSKSSSKSYFGLNNKISTHGRSATISFKSRLDSTQLDSTRIDTLDQPIAKVNYVNYQTFIGFPISGLSRKKTLQPLDKEFHRHYHVEHTKTIGDSIGVFTFTPKKRPFITRLFTPKKQKMKAVEAQAYIHLQSYDLLKFTATYEKIPAIFNKVKSYRIPTLSFEYRFKENFIPLYVKVDSFFDNIFTKTSDGRVPLETIISSTLVFYEHSSIYDPQYFSKATTFLESKNDTLDVSSTTYDPSFWEKNPILKRTPAEKEVMQFMEEYGLFGVYGIKPEN